MTLRLLFALSALLQAVLCANILYVVPVPSPSHHVWNRVLAVELAEKGHNVTLLTHTVEKKQLHPNLTVITMEGFYEEVATKFSGNEFEDTGVLSVMSGWANLVLFTVNYDYKTEGFKSLLNYPKDFKFDLMVFDSSWIRSMYCLIEHFNNPPVILTTPFLLSPYLSVSFGRYPIISQDPHQLTEFTNKMSLFERMMNAFYTYAELIYVDYFFSPSEEALVKKYYPKISIPLAEFERRASVLLSNIDPIMDFPIWVPQNIIPIGGMHARPSKPLPKDLKKIMDEAKHGVVLFSLGTNVKSDKLDSKIIQNFLKAFSKLPQIVLWKFESKLENVPKNVIINKWMPQNDILGHPNLKLFITHGGALSSQEAIYHGVPTIGIPFFGDQMRNVNKMISKKIGVKLGSHELTLENIDKALKEVLSTEMYAKNVQLLSRKYRDQPQSPLDRAVYWVEYIMKHGEAEHLATPSRDMPFYQTLNLDVALVVASVLFLLYWFVRLAIKILLFTVCKLNSKNVQKNKVKKS